MSPATRKALAVFAGYNLPFLLWTDWAVFRIVVPGSGFCLSRKMLPFLSSCPGCGLTGEYSSFLSGHQASPFFFAVFGLFLVNLLWSTIVFVKSLKRPGETRTV